MIKSRWLDVSQPSPPGDNGLGTTAPFLLADLGPSTHTGSSFRNTSPLTGLVKAEMRNAAREKRIQFHVSPFVPFGDALRA
jgi:hypothetical protein